MARQRSPAAWLMLIAIILIPVFAARGGQTSAASAASQDRDHRDQPISTVPRLTVRPSMVADNIEQLAGKEVTIFNARVVGVFQPNAFLIESATRRPEILGHRDRLLVLIEDGALRVPAELLVASTVRVTGVARTLLGLRLTGEVPWPRQVDDELIERLEIRASVLATSVQTAEGVELTERRTGGSADDRR